MGNSQGNQNDSTNVSEKQRKASTVRGRVLARFRSRNSLQSKDNTVVNCDNEFTNIQTERPTNVYDVYETADVQSFEQVDKKRISQISQGADSAKDAMDLGKFEFLYSLLLLLVSFFIVNFNDGCFNECYSLAYV